MELERLEARLDRAFRAKPQRLGEARIAWRRKPIPLSEHLGSALEPEKVDEYRGTLAAWPGTVEEMLGGRLRDVLAFSWCPETPISFVAGLRVLDFGRRGYLCFHNECHSYLAVALLDPWQDELVLSAAVKRLLRENGRKCGLELFGSIPHQTVNSLPDLLLTPVVKQAYFEWLLWAAEHPPAPAHDAEHVRLPAEEWLEAARGKPVATLSKRALEAWIALSDLRRQQMFDAWFESTYEVAR
jgi:hypothetical protein